MSEAHLLGQTQPLILGTSDTQTTCKSAQPLWMFGHSRTQFLQLKRSFVEGEDDRRDSIPKPWLVWRFAKGHGNWLQAPKLRHSLRIQTGNSHRCQITIPGMSSTPSHQNCRWPVTAVLLRATDFVQNKGFVTCISDPILIQLPMKEYTTRFL